MTDSTTYTCPYCRNQSSGAGTSCPLCGAPVDAALRTTASGWTELPPVADMAKIQLGQTTCQIGGKLVPTAEFKLGDGEGVYFPHPSFLWSEEAVNVDNMELKKAWKRMRAGMPLFMLQANGPGRIAFSGDTAGEMLAVPLQPGQSVDVREHQMVVASSAIAYDWIDTGIWFSTRGSGTGGATQSAGKSILKMGLDLANVTGGDIGDRPDQQEIEYHYPCGQFLDRFTATDKPGAVFVQAGGNTFVRDLAEGEQIMVKPPALLYKESSVGMGMHVEFPHAGFKIWRAWGNRYLWLRLWGPGRVALQSAYDRLEDPGSDFRESCQFSQQAW